MMSGEEKGTADSLTQAERDFIQENTAFWSQYFPGGETQGGGYVLVEHNYHPIILLCNAALAAIVCAARNLKPLFLLSSPRDIAYRQILHSFHPESKFLYLDDWRYILARYSSYFQARNVFRSLRSPADILTLKVAGIRCGDLVYDGALNEGYATLDKLDGRTLRALHAFFWHRYVVKDILRRNDIKTAVFSHVVGLKSGAYTRHLLQRGIEVFNRSGSYQLQVKKYRTLDDAGIYCLKPEPQYFSFLMNYGGGEILQRADKYLDDRFNQNIKDIAVDLAFDSRKRTFTSKEEFCRHFGLDPAKKVIFVMLHAFNDQPHSHFARLMLYQDYYAWFRRTLEIARNVTSVNWVFKEHPAADFYPTKDVSLDDIFAGVQSSHIRFLNRRADINARSLRYVADAIITCMGTAGLEYATQGIPCVLAGESPYSGFGFTAEPETITQYEEQLRHIAELPRLEPEQIKAAKMVTYFQHSMMQGGRFLFCPFYEDYQKIRNITLPELCQDMADLLHKSDPEVMMRQVTDLVAFLNNPTYTHYLDLEKYPFMREAVYGASATK